jgi:hypothetical protein
LHQDSCAVVKKILAFSIALSCAAVVALSVAAGETSSLRVNHHVHHAPHHVRGLAGATLPQHAPNTGALAPFSWLTQLFPNVKPYPPGQGDADGLSRNIDDCNKGCIGVNTVR